MRETKYLVKITSQFKRDYKLAMKRGMKISLLDEVVTLLSNGDPHKQPCLWLSSATALTFHVDCSRGSMVDSI